MVSGLGNGMRICGGVVVSSVRSAERWGWEFVEYSIPEKPAYLDERYRPVRSVVPRRDVSEARRVAWSATASVIGWLICATARPMRLAAEAIRAGKLGRLTFASWRFGGEPGTSVHPHANLIETQCHGLDLRWSAATTPPTPTPAPACWRSTG